MISEVRGLRLLVQKLRSIVITGPAALLLCLSSAQAGEAAISLPFPALALPPEVGELVGLYPAFRKGRSAHVSLVRREAERQGVPPEVADAVAHVESSYNPQAVGGVGEIGLMQIRPQTAAMLGYAGPVAGLFDPETNVRYSVGYLAGAWRLANGDLCRALMKYRAGHGEVRMTPLSAEYCRRAKSYLAVLGSPLGQGAHPDLVEGGTFSPARRGRVGASITGTRPGTGLVRLASLARMDLTGPQINAISGHQVLRRMRKLKGAAFWAAHEARIKAITAKIRASQVRRSAGS